MPSMPWAECYIGSDPGVPLDRAGRLPGTPVPEKGRVHPSDAPGFGLELQEEWLQPFAA
jgi:L-rhamnonate dehydratase